MIDPKKKILETTSESIGSSHERRRFHRIENEESTLPGGKRQRQKIIRKSKEKRWNREPDFKFPKYRYPS